MDTMLDFDQVARELEAMRLVNFDDAFSGLISAKMCTTHAAVLNEFAPDRLGEIRGVNLLGNVRNGVIYQSTLENAICEVLPTLFPCDVDHLIEEIYNNEGELPNLLWDPLLNYSYDTISEMILEPEYFGEGSITSLVIFAWYLCEGVDAEYFERAAQHFRWQLDAPECSVHNQGFDSVDDERFYAALDEHSLSEFKLPFQCIQHAIGNRYLDYTLDDVYEDGLAYCVETVRDLAAEWTEAQPKIDEINTAAERFQKDKWIAAQIAGLWDECIHYKDGRRPHTLMELWGGVVGDPGIDDEEEAEDD